MLNGLVGSQEKRKRGLSVFRLVLLLVVFAMAAMLLYVKPVQAASMKSSAKPKFVLEQCKQSWGSATLTWNKVKGAKKYVVYRSQKKNGKYKKFATTKKLTITKASNGEFFYKVQAVSGGTKSKMSKPVHLFAAQGNVYDARRFTAYIYVGGFRLGGRTTTWLYAAMANNTKKPMVFAAGASVSIMQLNTSTGELKEVNTGTVSEAVTINPGTEGKIEVKTGSVSIDKGTKLIVNVPFNAGGQEFHAYLGYKEDGNLTWIAALDQ